MSREILFTDAVIGLSGKFLKDCELALECNQGNYRLYVDKDPERMSFLACAVEFASCGAYVDSVWDCPLLEVTPLFNVTALFDGVRHLEFNRDDEDMSGYIYYPDMLNLIALMQKVRDIELEICDPSQISE